MGKEIAVQTPATFRRGCRRKLIEKYKDTWEDLPLNLSLIEEKEVETRSTVTVLSETTVQQTHTQVLPYVFETNICSPPKRQQIGENEIAPIWNKANSAADWKEVGFPQSPLLSSIFLLHPKYLKPQIRQNNRKRHAHTSCFRQQINSPDDLFPTVSFHPSILVISSSSFPTLFGIAWLSWLSGLNHSSIRLKVLMSSSAICCFWHSASPWMDYINCICKRENSKEFKQGEFKQQNL